MTNTPKTKSKGVMLGSFGKFFRGVMLGSFEKNRGVGHGVADLADFFGGIGSRMAATMGARDRMAHVRCLGA